MAVFKEATLDLCLPERLQHITHLLLNEQKILYLLVDEQLSVVESGGQLSLLEQIDLSNMLIDLIPELIGCEDLLTEILNGDLPNFQLENINRIDKNNVTHYLNLNLVLYSYESKPFLLTILSDNTCFTQTQQILTQQRNELSLLKGKLDDTNQQLNFLLQHYVPREVSKALLEQRIMPSLGGTVREVTLLFADLRNYTSISEQITPTETIELLHICLDIAVSAILEAGGVILNYMGDAVMAIFNAPDELSNHAAHAVRAGLNLQETARAYQEQMLENKLPIFFGVGINTGEAVIGNVGAGGHYQYTAIGDTVNVASRLCSHAGAGKVLIGAQTHAAIANRSEVTALTPIRFKGKSTEQPVYEVKSLF